MVMCRLLLSCLQGFFADSLAFWRSAKNQPVFRRGTQRVRGPTQKRALNIQEELMCYAWRSALGFGHQVLPRASNGPCKVI